MKDSSSILPSVSPVKLLSLARQFLSHLLSTDAAKQACIEPMSTLGIPWLRAQGLAPLAWYILRKVDNVPPDLANELRMAYYAAAADAELHERELAQVLQVLAKQDVKPIVFKGAVLAHTVYPTPACRQMGDLDLWITADEMSWAQQALESIGYVAYDKVNRPLAMMKQNRGELQMHGRQAGTGLVELHWGTFAGEWLQRTSAVDEKGISKRTVPVTLIEQPAMMLAPEDAIIQLAIHFAVNHQMAYPWLRCATDIVLLTRAYPVDWNVLIERARDWRVSVAVWLALKVVIDVAELNQAMSAIGQLSPSPARRWLLNQFANAGSVVQMRDLRWGPLRFVYLLLLVDRFQDAVHLVWHALWPKHEWLMMRYGQADLDVRLRHLVDAARGRL